MSGSARGLATHDRRSGQTADTPTGQLYVRSGSEAHKAARWHNAEESPEPRAILLLQGQASWFIPLSSNPFKAGHSPTQYPLARAHAQPTSATLELGVTPSPLPKDILWTEFEGRSDRVRGATVPRFSSTRAATAQASPRRHERLWLEDSDEMLSRRAAAACSLEARSVAQTADLRLPTPSSYGIHKPAADGTD
ncbi:hypothetical protein VTO73DRAFT_2867 [Trametes versicolor]